MRDLVQVICKSDCRQSAEQTQSFILKLPFSYHKNFLFLSPNFCNKWDKNLMSQLVHSPNFIPICIKINYDIAGQKVPGPVVESVSQYREIFG